MSITCAICFHAARAAIDAALAAQVSLRAIAAQYGVSRSTLGRHAAHVGHVGHAAPAPAAPPAYLVNRDVAHALEELCLFLKDRQHPVDARSALLQLTQILLRVVKDGHEA